MLVNASQAGGVSFRNVFEVLYHGCPLDLSMSGYLTIVPALVLIASEWVKPTIIAKIYAVYYFVVLLLIAVIVVADVMLYPYWGFHFDDTVFLYLQQPKEAMASAPAGQIMLGILGIAAFTYITYAGYRYTIKKRVLKLRRPRLLLATPVVLLVLIGALFLPIRGGVTVSTMNIGKVYFSDNLFLNHAAINQPFNLLYALTKPNNFAAEYQFYPKEKAEGLFAQLQAQPAADTTPGYLNTRRPNILFIILESFGAFGCKG